MTDEIENYVIVHKDDLRTALFWFNRAINLWKHSQSAEEPMDKGTIATYRRLAEQYDGRMKNVIIKPSSDAAPREEPSEKEAIQMRMLMRARDRLIAEGKSPDEAARLAWEALSAPSRVKLPTIDELDDEQTVEHEALEHIGSLMSERVATPLRGYSCTISTDNEIVGNTARVNITANFPAADISRVANQYDEDWCANRATNAAPQSYADELAETLLASMKPISEHPKKMTIIVDAPREPPEKE